MLGKRFRARVYFRHIRAMCIPLVTFLVFTPTLGQATSEKIIRLSVGLSIPPYVIAPQDRGAELDIVREALAVEDYTVVPLFASNIRRNVQYIKGTTDGVMTVSLRDTLPGYYSDAYIEYRNVAISLASQKLSINNTADLTDKSITGFQTASSVLGEDFSKLVMQHPGYREVVDQRLQNIQLFSKHTDVIVGDFYIFNWISRNGNLPSGLDTKQPISIHSIFPPSPKYMVFRSKTICEAFNRGIKTLIKSGRYQEILEAYGIT